MLVYKAFIVSVQGKCVNTRVYKVVILKDFKWY